VPASIGRTDSGRVRDGNEDVFVADDDLCLYAVADGMGGHHGSEIASQVAISTLASFVRDSRHDPAITWPFGFNTLLSFEANQLQSAVRLANQQVRYRAQCESAYNGMGSTLVAVLLAGERAVFVNVGDSRLYLWRQAALTQVSEDDSWAAAMLRAGAAPEAASRHEMRHVLTRAVGQPLDLEVMPHHLDLEAADVLLLCSDGLHGPLGSDGIASVLAAAGENLARAANALVEAANAAGGPDNITVVLVRVHVD
jgi:serine/threonine protein phosphatase PrpC